MPYDDPDATDPMTLHGVSIETDNADAARDMAICFIEEFLRMGFAPERLRAMFRSPPYAGPYMAFQALGESEIDKLIDEQVRFRGPRVSADASAPHSDGDISLPVLDPIGESHGLRL